MPFGTDARTFGPNEYDISNLIDNNPELKETIMPEPTVLFLHLPKTAGTTFNSILRLEYRNKIYSCPVIPSGDSRVAYQSLDPEKRKKFRLIRGHFYYGLHEDVPGNSEYITFVRDPIRRVASFYHYFRSVSTNDSPIIPKAAKMTLVDFISHHVTHECENDQVRRIAGVQPADAPVTKEHLRIACRNLESFACFGLTERFDEALMLIWQRLGWWVPPVYVKSKTVNKSGNLGDKERAVIAEHNALDIELYRFAQELFAKRIAEQPTLAQQVERFRKLNQAAKFVLPAAMYARRKIELVTPKI